MATQTKVEIITWKGHCEVHERFTGEELRAYREADPGVKIIAHPECAPDVLAEADFTGSTSGMIKWVNDHQPSKVLLVTECSMSDNVAVEAPNVQVRAAVQSLPAYEADHAAQDSGGPRASSRRR